MSAAHARATNTRNSSESITVSPLLKTLLVAGAVAVAAAAGYAAWRWRAKRRRRAALPDPAANQLLRFDTLHHSYFMVRHGESTANVAALISSDPSISTVTHGLTPLGREQVATQVGQWSLTLPSNQPIVVLSSDFTRARETAEIVHKRLRVRHPLQLHTELRERFFGAFNGTSTQNYERVWQHDARSSAHTEFECESVDSVVRRTTAFIARVEAELDAMLNQHAAAEPENGAAAAVAATSPAASARRMSAAGGSPSSSSAIGGPVPRHTVILVAHGDVCQILNTAFLRSDPSKHRSLPHWCNGEMRPLVLVPPHKTAASVTPAPTQAPAQH
jgi:probable phosphoglycerate mutase